MSNKIPIYPTPEQIKGFLDGSITAFSVPIPADCEISSIPYYANNCLKYPVGTILVCREKWRVDSLFSPNIAEIEYSDGKITRFEVYGKLYNTCIECWTIADVWQNPTHMPYAFSRCKLGVISNKVERYRDRCPRCMSFKALRWPRNHDFYCEHCGWPGAFMNPEPPSFDQGSWKRNLYVERTTVKLRNKL